MRHPTCNQTLVAWLSAGIFPLFLSSLSCVKAEYSDVSCHLLSPPWFHALNRDECIFVVRRRIARVRMYFSNTAKVTHITCISHANKLARKQKWESFFVLWRIPRVCVWPVSGTVWLNGQYCNLCSRGSICPISNGEERGYSLTLDLHQHSARKRIIGKPPSFRDKCPSTRQ